MSSSPPIASHGYAAPTAADSLAALTRVVGPERAEVLWSEACRGAGLAHAGDPLSLEELQATSEQLRAHGGAIATVAYAMQIRLRTYARLAARGQTPAPHAAEAAR
jgi:hypothetical protein